MKACVEQTFDGATAPYSGYDYTKITLGPLINQYNDGTGASTDHYCGPMKMGFVRVMEQVAQGGGGSYPSVIRFTETLDWVFLADVSATAATRRIFLFTFDRTTSNFAYIGCILMTYPTEASTVTIAGFRTPRQLYISGTIYGLTGTNTITGYQTGWSGKNLPAGTRIGFGSSTPSLVSGWYRVSGYTGTGDTTLTLRSNLATTYASGTPYVIDDLRILTLVSSATAIKGGLYMTKGIAYEDFITGAGTPISGTYSATDGAAGLYYYMDAAVGTYPANVVGMGLEPMIDWNTQYVYCINSPTALLTPNIKKYNIRANLTMGFSGKTTAPYPISTGIISSLTGNLAVTNNGRYAVLNHGACSGVPSIFFVTASKIYRVPTSLVTAGNTTFYGDALAGWSELPTGTVAGTGAYAAPNFLTSVEYSDALDRLYVMSTGSAGQRSYVTRYDPAIGAFDHIFLIDTKQQDQAATQSAAPGLPQIPSITASNMSVWTEGGIAYMCRNTTVVATNQMYAVPTSVDWNYTYKTHSVLMTPQISTPGAKKFYRVYVNFMRDMGTTPYCHPTEPFRLSYRTTGITDNTGVWHAIDETGDLTGISATSKIQFQFEFQAIGTFELMPRIYSLTVIYEDSGNDSHYTPSVSNTVVASRIFAFRQQATWGGTIPALTMTITNAITGGPVLTDTTTDSAYGIWQYSTNGTSWNSWSTSADAVGNYIRYSGTTLPSGITAKATVSL